MCTDRLQRVVQPKAMALPTEVFSVGVENLGPRPLESLIFGLILLAFALIVPQHLLETHSAKDTFSTGFISIRVGGIVTSGIIKGADVDLKSRKCHASVNPYGSFSVREDESSEFENMYPPLF